jgi:serine/threonine protein kinase
MPQYEIVEKIGNGAYSDVFKIKHTSRHYAMKKINIVGMTNNQKKYLLSELKIISNHTCPFIIKFFTASLQDEHLCIIMEHCSKGTLEQFIKTNSMTNDTVWKYFAQLCGGVSYLHSNHIIHRDLKVANILIDEQSNIKIIDFGVSKILNNYMKFTKSFVGTPMYMSPEVFKNSFYDYKIDIWALGVILYQMTHKNKLPFQSKSMEQLCAKINNPVLNIDQGVLGGFRVIITRSLQPSPHRRIKLESILKHAEIKRHLKGVKLNPSTKHIQQIDSKLPDCTIEWNKVIDKVPNNLPQTPPDSREKMLRKINYDFMSNYSKDNLVQLNGRLIDMIIEKNAVLKHMEEELRELRQLKIAL